MKNNVCKTPFFTAEIFGGGDVYCCCPDYLKIGPIGNIFRNNWDEVWNSQTAVEFRNKIKEGNYSSCNTNYCDPNFFPLCQELKYVDSEKLDINNPKARIVKFSVDRSCNVACTLCRGEIICNKPEKVEFLDSHIEKTFIPILKDVEIVNFTGSGDPFASKHYRKFIKIITERFPNIRFDFHTNGTLCDERNLTDLGVIDKLSTIQISLHSATKEIYDKIVKHGNWERLNKNLEFLAGLIEKGKLNELQLNFVVMSENFRDIPAFVELCKKYHAKAFFWQYRDLFDHYDFDSVDIFSPLHKNHREFVEIMNKIDATDSNIYMTPLLKRYTKIKNLEDYFITASIITDKIIERYESKTSATNRRFGALERRVLNLERMHNAQKQPTFAQKIFSIRNEGERKVLRVLFLKFSFKRKNKI